MTLKDDLILMHDAFHIKKRRSDLETANAIWSEEMAKVIRCLFDAASAGKRFADYELPHMESGVLTQLRDLICDWTTEERLGVTFSFSSQVTFSW